VTVIFLGKYFKIFLHFFCHPRNDDIFGEKVFCLNVTEIKTEYDNKIIYIKKVFKR